MVHVRRRAGHRAPGGRSLPRSRFASRRATTSRTVRAIPFRRSFRPTSSAKLSSEVIEESSKEIADAINVVNTFILAFALDRGLRGSPAHHEHLPDDRHAAHQGTGPAPGHRGQPASGHDDDPSRGAHHRARVGSGAAGSFSATVWAREPSSFSRPSADRRQPRRRSRYPGPRSCGDSSPASAPPSSRLSSPRSTLRRSLRWRPSRDDSTRKRKGLRRRTMLGIALPRDERDRDDTRVRHRHSGMPAAWVGVGGGLALIGTILVAAALVPPSARVAPQAVRSDVRPQRTHRHEQRSARTSAHGEHRWRAHDRSPAAEPAHDGIHVDHEPGQEDP